MLNIGPLAVADSSDATKVELLSRVLAETSANASLVVADEDGLSWSAIRSAAQVIKYVENHSPNGTNNFDFAAVAMVPPNVPFFPASNHDGAGAGECVTSLHGGRRGLSKSHAGGASS